MTTAAETLGYDGLVAVAYDHDKFIGRSFGDVEFYRAALEGCERPVLEPAVGNGRLLIPLMEAGFEVDGFDASAAMIALCEGHCQARGLSPRLEVARFEDFDFGRRYGAVIVPASSFMLIETFEAGMAALRRFADHLAPGGRLIVDLFLPGEPIAPTPDVHWTLAGGDVLTIETRPLEFNRLAQRTVSHLRYQRWRGGALIDSTLQRFALRWWGVGEFRLALEASGFVDIEVCGNYRPGRPPRATDGVFTFTTTRG